MKFIIILSLMLVGVTGCSTNTTVAECTNQLGEREPAKTCETKPTRERHVFEKLNRP